MVGYYIYYQNILFKLLAGSFSCIQNSTGYNNSRKTNIAHARRGYIVCLGYWQSNARIQAAICPTLLVLYIMPGAAIKSFMNNISQHLKQASFICGIFLILMAFGSIAIVITTLKLDNALMSMITISACIVSTSLYYILFVIIEALRKLVSNQSEIIAYKKDDNEAIEIESELEVTNETKSFTRNEIKVIILVIIVFIILWLFIKH